MDALINAKETVANLLDGYLDANPEVIGFRKFVAVKDGKGLFVDEDTALKLKGEGYIFKAILRHNIVSIELV